MANRQQLQIEAAVDLLLAETLDGHQRELIGAWGSAWDTVSGEVEAALMELAAQNTGGTVTRTTLLRSQRLQDALAALLTALDTLASEGATAAGGLARSIIEDSAAATTSMLTAALPPTAQITAQVTGANPAQIRAMLERTTQTMHKQAYMLSREAETAIKTQILKGITVGDNPRKAARDAVRGIEDLWNGGLARATTLARTEMIDAHRAAAQHVEKQNTDVLDGWEWVAHLGKDKRTCRACLAMHGTLHPTSEFGPKGHPNCRCARVPKTKSWDELGITGVRPPKSLTVDADEWFKKLPEAAQRDILTERGYVLWKQGKYPREKWVSKRTSNGAWRDSYAPTQPKRMR